MRAEDDGSRLVVERPNDERMSRALHGLTRTLIANMMLGVTEGFSKDLEIVGVGYRATAKGPGQLELALGFSHPVVVDAPEGITFEVPAPTHVTVRGVDKERVGQVAADVADAQAGAVQGQGRCGRRAARAPPTGKAGGVVMAATGSPTSFAAGGTTAASCC